jgi:hypothetical protein
VLCTPAPRPFAASVEQPEGWFRLAAVAVVEEEYARNGDDLSRSHPKFFAATSRAKLKGGDFVPGKSVSMKWLS